MRFIKGVFISLSLSLSRLLFLSLSLSLSLSLFRSLAPSPALSPRAHQPSVTVAKCTTRGDLCSKCALSRLRGVLSAGNHLRRLVIRRLLSATPKRPVSAQAKPRGSHGDRRRLACCASIGRRGLLEASPALEIKASRPAAQAAAVTTSTTACRSLSTCTADARGHGADSGVSTWTRVALSSHHPSSSAIWRRGI